MILSARNSKCGWIEINFGEAIRFSTDCKTRSPRAATFSCFGGYHLKNAYQLKYSHRKGDEKSSSDPMLGKAEQLFHAALGIHPDDPSAKNGLGNIYWLRGNLDAAEFFVKHAVEKARKIGIQYPEAERDLREIRREKARRAATQRPD